MTSPIALGILKGMTPFAVGMVRVFFWLFPPLFAYLAARARPGRVRSGLLIAALVTAAAIKPLPLGFFLAGAGYLLALFPSGRRTASTKGQAPRR